MREWRKSCEQLEIRSSGLQDDSADKSVRHQACEYEFNSHDPNGVIGEKIPAICLLSSICAL